MRLLLDTHTLLWWMTNDPRLSSKVQALMLDGEIPTYVSAVSAWEVSTKHRIGKLTGIPGLMSRYAEVVVANGFLPLPIEQRHALLAGGMVSDHRDPFDRMLAAQAVLEGLTLVTNDGALQQLPEVTTIW